MHKKSLIFSLAILVPSLALAQQVARDHLIPVVAKIKGQAGTDWVSDVSLTNLEHGDVTVTFFFFPENRDNTFPPPFVASRALGSFETLTLTDIVGTLFPTAGNNTKGAVVLMANDPTAQYPEPPLAVTSRTYNNADPNRTYGQTVPSAGGALVWGSGKAILTGLRQDSRFRTNIGVLNVSSANAPQPPRLSVAIRIYGPHAEPIREIVKEIKSLSLSQWGLPELGVNGLAGGFAEVAIHPADPNYDRCQVRPGGDLGADGPLFLAYFSQVDQATGDAVFGLGQVDWRGYEGCPQPPDGDPCR